MLGCKFLALLVGHGLAGRLLVVRFLFACCSLAVCCPVLLCCLYSVFALVVVKAVTGRGVEVPDHSLTLVTNL